MPSYRLVALNRPMSIPILRDPLTVADQISAEIHRVPAVVRAANARRASEQRDLHLSTARAALLALGLPETWVATIMAEAEAMVAP